MDNQRNTIIAIILLALVWIGFQMVFSPPPAAPPEERSLTGEVSGEQGQSAGEIPGEEEGGPQAPAVPEALSLGEIQVRNLVVDNGMFVVRLSNVGGGINQLLLKNFQEEADPDSPSVRLVDFPAEDPGTLLTSGSGNFDLPPNLIYQVDSPSDSIHLKAGERRDIIFTGQTVNGMIVQKVYGFTGGEYPVRLKVTLRNGGSQTLHGGLTLKLVEPWSGELEGGRLDYVGPVTFGGGEVHTGAVKDLDEKKPSYDQVLWTGFENKYFLSSVIALQEEKPRVEILKVGDSVVNLMNFGEISLKGGDQTGEELLLYYGPRDLDILKAVDHQLAEAIDFGFFAHIARPLLHALKFFYQYLGNYGVAIILITVIIKLLFWPLTQKSYTSMKAMQKLQPEMAKIREKYKNDRERLNREIMELYKTHRVNPLGGCLPMIIQIPVFFALYKVLLGSIELRHAPFFLWITDLSVKDPYYVTPVLMGATMFLQQKMSPSTMDPAQAKIFMLMPIVFTFLFLNFPAGLVIYWLVNNVLSIGQQAYINYRK